MCATPISDGESGREVPSQLLQVGEATQALQQTEESIGSLEGGRSGGKGDHELAFFAVMPPVGCALRCLAHPYRILRFKGQSPPLS